MGALETLLNYKAQKEAQKNADINAIPQAIAQFQAGRQQASDNLIKQLTLQATLAKSGLRLGPGNQLIKDDSLSDPLKALKVQDLQSKIDARTANSALLNQFLGGGGPQNLPPGTTMNTATGGLNVPLVKDYTEGEAKTLSTADSLLGQIGELKQLIVKDKNTYESATTTGEKIKGVLGSSQLLSNVGPKGYGESGQNYKLLRDSISERLLRLRSGAQINESEYKRFTNLLPSIFRNDSIDIKQLENFEKEFSSIAGRINEGGKYDSKLKDFVKGNDIPDGQTGTAKDGTPVVRKGGKWVAA